MATRLKEPGLEGRARHAGGVRSTSNHGALHCVFPQDVALLGFVDKSEQRSFPMQIHPAWGGRRMLSGLAEATAPTSLCVAECGVGTVSDPRPVLECSPIASPAFGLVIAERGFAARLCQGR
jgi:hypothetical protein